MTLNTLLNEWESLIERAFYDYTGQGRAYARKTVMRFLMYVGKSVRNITPLDVDNFILSELRSKRSVQTQIRMLKKFFSYLDLLGYSNARAILQLLNRRLRTIKPEDPPKRTYMTKDEARRFLNTLNQLCSAHRLKRCYCLAFRLMLIYGLRLDETRSIRPSNVDVNNRHIEIMRKGRKVDYVHIVDDETWSLVVELMSKVNGDDPLIPVSGRAIEIALKRVLAVASLPRNITPHSLRRTAAHLAYATQRDIEKVRIFLGHSKITTTQIYLEQDIKERQETKKEMARAVLSLTGGEVNE